jgi:ABC-type branched-subunit amino acid transport system permease subunit
MKRPTQRSIRLKRLGGCLVGSLVLANLWGPQEGVQSDYGYAFRQAVFGPRIVVFLAMGVVLFLGITYNSVVQPYLTRPGVRPLAAGALTVIVSQTLLHWNDQVGDAKFGTIAAAVGGTRGLSPLAVAFFGWLAWSQFTVIFVAIAFAAARRNRLLGWLGTAGSALAAVVALVSHANVASYVGGVDHSLGSAVCALGYLTMASAGATVAMSTQDVANTRAFIDHAFDWRPGMPLVVVGLISGLLSFLVATWFSPGHFNATLVDTSQRFTGSGLAPLAAVYLKWMCWVLLLVAVAAAGAGSYVRNTTLAWVGTGVGAAGVVLTLVSIYDLSSVAGARHVDAATGPWQNLGSGGWLACIAFSFVAAGGYLTAAGRTGAAAARGSDARSAPRGSDSANTARGRSNVMKSIVLGGIVLALFYPPTTTPYWQTVLVSEIGVYVLLAVGLNVVVGWAGLLDLGYIAFFAIGSYTTAYLVGSLPVKPPAWLHMTPLLAMPFAIVVCVIAGVTLGAPTLRLRGDYLAVVTLGFGEIIRITAINADGFTNSTRGPSPPVPHPVIHIGPINLTWGLTQLQYWYPLLILIGVVIILFSRLEASRLGRAWAAIREDEVAAQATGINTSRVKLLAFAIGASTSGITGVFFASQVGYFNPDNFVLANSILVVAYVVFGGMGSLPGVIAGTVLLTWLPEFLRDQVPPPDRQMWIGGLLLMMMIFRPGGLIPAKRRQAELGGLGQPMSAEPRAVPLAEGM